MTVNIAKFFGVLGLSALAAGSAQALTTIDSVSANGGGSVVASSFGTFANVDFTWGSAPASGYAEFTIDTDSFVYIADYSGPTGSGYTGFMLVEQGGATLTTDQGAACNNLNVLLPVRGGCDLVTNQTSPGLTSSNPSTATAYTMLTAGTYYIGMYEGSQPADGFLSFQISEGEYQEVTPVAPVPLPAGGLMLVGALGGIAALRRRKKA